MVLYQPEFFGAEDFFFAEPVRDESFPPHLHRCMEWMYLVSGSVELQLEEGQEVLSPDQGALLLPGTIHSFRCLSAGEWFYLCFAPEWVPAFGEGSRALHPDRPVFTPDPALARQLLAADGRDRLHTKGLLYLLCAEFRNQTSWQPAPKRQLEPVCRLMEQVQAGFDQPLTLEGLARTMGYEPHYLSRLVRQRLGVTFTEYLNRYRVALSCQMLRERDWPITRIAGQCGYGSLRNFNKAFKAITGLTPRQYRQQAAAGKTTPLPPQKNGLGAPSFPGKTLY